jgi:allophanate hydrolase subunit 2
MKLIVRTVGKMVVGNDLGTEVLEMTLAGPELLFTASAVFCVTGGLVAVSVDGEDRRMWSRLTIQARQKLKIARVENGGLRFYLAV